VSSGLSRFQPIFGHVTSQLLDLVGAHRNLVSCRHLLRAHELIQKSNPVDRAFPIPTSVTLIAKHQLLPGVPVAEVSGDSVGLLYRFTIELVYQFTVTIGHEDVLSFAHLDLAEFDFGAGSALSCLRGSKPENQL